MEKIFWRSKDGKSAPPKARFHLWPFVGKRLSLEHFNIVSELTSPSKGIRVIKRVDKPTKEEWVQKVRHILSYIQAGSLQKVVLARETTLHLEKAPDPFQLTAALAKKSVGATLFCIQFDKEKAFFGATPERLFRSDEQTLFVEAVAGTRKRGATLSENESLIKELLSSSKDISEFQFVQDYFKHYFPSISFAPSSIHSTANVHHLFSQGTCPLPSSLHPLDLVEILHPTPALAGVPKKEALLWIQAQEPFARNLYGGIIGWEDKKQSEWSVAIRSCLLEGSIAKLYTGVGIVADSDPDLEWEELEAKLSLYDSLFENL